MTRDAALAWIRAHETDSNEQAALALLVLLDEETSAIHAHYRKRIADLEAAVTSDEPLELERKRVGQ